MPFTKNDPNINRTGKNKGAISLVHILRQKLAETPLEDNLDKQIYAQLFINKYVDKALKDGDVQIMKDLIDRIDGKANQKIEHSGEIITTLTDEQKEKLRALLDYDKSSSIKSSDRGNATGKDLPLQ
jgi:hypothetical protein